VIAPMRGQLFRVDVGFGANPWLVVSNNSRNRNLHTVLAVRVTTTSKHADVPTVVRLTPAEPIVGFVLCDDMVQLYRDELDAPIGALTPTTMAAVSRSLALALGLA